jgi:DNA-binding NtrC family response regulator
LKGIYPKQFKKDKVLMAAADEKLAEFYREILMIQGFEMAVVTSLTDILKTLAEEHFDIVLPTNFGLNPVGIRDVVLSIRETHPLVGIVVVSGWFDSAPEMMFGPVDVFFTAPVDFEVLTSTIRATVCHTCN